MAIYHFSVGFVSRSTGRSAVQAAAYITGEKLVESRRDLVADYSNRQGDVLASKTYAPEQAPAWMRDLTVWDKIESFEDAYAAKRYRTDETREQYLSSAQTAQTYIAALPIELNPKVLEEIVDDYIDKRFISRNLVATMAIHKDEGNPHVHMVVSRRSVTAEGEFSTTKDREIATKKELIESRRLWAEVANHYLEREGIDARIDHRSFAAQGISFEPTQHEGWYAKALESQGHQSRVVTKNQEITGRNKELAALDPEAVLKELTCNQATFRMEDLARAVQKRVGDDPVLCQAVFEQARQQAMPIGRGLDGTARYTSKDYLGAEEQALHDVGQMLAHKTKITIQQAAIAEVLSKPNEKGFMLNEEQQQAVKTLCGDQLMSVLVGRAGTGKTTALKPVVALHKEAGYEVLGAALAAVAADNLAIEAKCDSETIAFYLHKWEEYEKAQRQLIQLQPSGDAEQDAKLEAKLISTMNFLEKHQLTDKHVLIIDEAGMVGTSTWEKVLYFSQKAKAKVIAVGDDHQFKAIEAGDFFRKLIAWAASKSQLATLSVVIRQEVKWMREATGQLAELNTATALATYEHRGHVTALASEALITTIATDYVNRLKESPTLSGLLLASTNAQVTELNAAVREQLITEGQVRPEAGTLTLNDRDYAVGDKIVFLKNDRKKKIRVYDQDGQQDKSYLVKNGTTAHITAIDDVILEPARSDLEPIATVKVTVEIDATTRADFYLEDCDNFSHGYALTLHKSQGQTVDWSIILASKNMDAYAAYVALTRHRQGMQLYYNSNEFATFSSLSQSMSRLGQKDLVIDYSISAERSEAWLDVQEYFLMGRELMLLAELKEWQAFKDLKTERQHVGRHLLEHWDEHREFVRQAGFTQESIAINSGLKARPLSVAEEKAQLTVDQYAAVALQARDLWQEIRASHPGVLAKHHPNYHLFDALRAERGSLANVIAAAPSLHRPFVKELGDSLGYGIAAIHKQAEAAQHRLIQDRLKAEITDPEQRQKLEVLERYLDSRDLAAQSWHELQPKLKETEGTLLKATLNSEVDAVGLLFKQRDILAHQITADFEAYVDVAQTVRLSLNSAKLFDQGERGHRALCIEQYTTSNSLLAKSMAACELVEHWQDDQKVGAKTTIRDLLQAGINLRELQANAHTFARQQLIASLDNSQDQSSYRLLDQYEQLKETAKAHYKLCREDSADKEIKPWDSAYYQAFTEVSRDRDAVAAEILSKPSQEMILMGEKLGVSLQSIDVEAHRHMLRQTSELFLKSLGTESVAAAQELKEWLDFDRDSGHKHTFGIIREMQYQVSDIGSHLRQVETNRRAASIDDYKDCSNVIEKAQMAADLVSQWQQEQATGSKKMMWQLLQSEINLKDLQNDAQCHQRHQIIAGIANDDERRHYILVHDYQTLQKKANSQFKQCLRDSTSKNIKPWESEHYPAFSEVSRDRDAVAAHLVKAPYHETAAISEKLGVAIDKIDIEAHRSSLRQMSEIFLSGMGAKSGLAATELKAWLDFDRDMGSKHTIGIMREMQYLPKEVVAYISEVESRAVNRFSVEKAVPRSFTSSKEINEQLKTNIHGLCEAVLGQPQSARPREWRYGRKGAIAIFVAGSKQGLYANFETGVSGGPLKMIEEQLNLTPDKALHWAKEWLGSPQTKVLANSLKSNKPLAKEQVWNPVLPVPAAAGKPNVDSNKFLSYMLKDREIKAIYPYYNEQKQLLGYVVRIEDKDGHKITPTLTYCQNDKGHQFWRWQGFGDNRPLYGLDRLSQDKPILIVEGEKTTDAAQKLLPEYTVVSWPGGTGSVHKADWSPLVGKDITIWPDNDAPGVKAAATIQGKLAKLAQRNGQTSAVKIVDLPKELPEKWDLADALPEGWSVEQVGQRIKQAKRTSHQTLLERVKQYSLDNLETALGQPDAKTNETISQTPIQNVIIAAHQTQAEQRMHEATGRSLDDYNQAMDQFMQRFGQSTAPSVKHKTEATKPLHEVEGQSFLDRYQAYDFDCKMNRVTPEKKAEFEKEVAQFAKNDGAVDYVKTRDHDAATAIERITKDLERQQTQNKGFDLSR